MSTFNIKKFLIENQLTTSSKLNEDGHESGGGKVEQAAMILPRGEKIILQAEENDYKRGLIIELTSSGGYKINYWYGEDIKIFPAEIEVDGESIKEDGKEVYIKFHPELDKDN